MEQQYNPVTVDAIIEREGRMLLIRRGHDPFEGQLALPGGFVDHGEQVEHAVIREIREELSLKITPTAILGVYSGNNRDPRGPIISVVFVCSAIGSPEAGDDADSFKWINMTNVAKVNLAFDHNQIVADYQQWKINNGSYWTAKTSD